MVETLCQICREFVLQKDLKCHQLRCVKYNFYCDKCDLLLPKSQEKDHTASHQESICPDCGLLLDMSSIASHLNNECLMRKVNCPDCGLVYQVYDRHECPFIDCEFCEESIDINEIHDHFKNCYAASRTTPCEICGKRVQQREMIEHMRQHECGEIESTFSSLTETVPCPTCEQSFDQYDAMVAHRVSEHQWEPVSYVCKYCGLSFLTMLDRSLHRKYGQCQETSAT